MAKSFFSTLVPLDAQRLQKSVKATVQSSGRLTFAMDAVKEMGLSEDKSIIILAADNGDLGAVMSTKGDPTAFVLKKCGAYFYVSFKNYLVQQGVDFRNFKIIYDITELDEKHPTTGKPIYKFERRMLPRGAEEQDPTDEPAPVAEEADGATTDVAAEPGDSSSPTSGIAKTATNPESGTATSAGAETTEAPAM